MEKQTGGYLHYFLFLILLLGAGVSVYAGVSELNWDSVEIASHPRLLIGNRSIDGLKVSVQKKPELQKMHDYVIRKSNDMLSLEPVSYKKDGKRLLAVSRLALTRIFFLSYSYRLTNEPKYLKRAEKELLAVSNFKDWNPSHFLDVGEMCMGVAIGYDWLYDGLKKSSREKIRDAILEKAFKASENTDYNWFYNSTNNWNQVCNAGLVMGALAVFDEEPAISKKIIGRAVKTNGRALKNYGPDGNYPEGPGYWNYGTSFQVMMLAGMKSVLGTDFGLSRYPGFMESAEYMLFSTGPSGLYFNYSDCLSKPYPAYPMFWFAKELNNPGLAFQEIELIEKGDYFEYRHGNDDRLLPSAIIFWSETEATALDMNVPDRKLWIGNGVTPVAYVRTSWGKKEAKYFGVKGGQASESHGHMDQGTFVYDIGGLRWAMDFGSQVYESLESSDVDLWNMGQSSQRWQIFRLNNLNHNTVSINNQPHNVGGKATIVKSCNTGRRVGVKMDMTDVLNLNDELKAAFREVKLINNEILEVKDCLVTEEKGVWLRWNMVTPACVRIIDNNTVELSQENRTLKLTFDGTVPLKLEIRPSEEPREVICEFTDTHYGEFNSPNPGTVMFGFNAFIPRKTKARFDVSMEESN